MSCKHWRSKCSYRHAVAASEVQFQFGQFPLGKPGLLPNVVYVSTSGVWQMSLPEFLGISELTSFFLSFRFQRLI